MQQTNTESYETLNKEFIILLHHIPTKTSSALTVSLHESNQVIDKHPIALQLYYKLRSTHFHVSISYATATVNDNNFPTKQLIKCGITD